MKMWLIEEADDEQVKQLRKWGYKVSEVPQEIAQQNGTTARLWTVGMEPVQRDERRAQTQSVYNAGGVLVFVTDGKVKSNIGRVGYARWRLKGSKKALSFKRALKQVLQRADIEADQLNGVTRDE
jgi:hypothetical protein